MVSRMAGCQGEISPDGVWPIVDCVDPRSEHGYFQPHLWKACQASVGGCAIPNIYLCGPTPLAVLCHSDRGLNQKFTKPTECYFEGLFPPADYSHFLCPGRVC